METEKSTWVYEYDKDYPQKYADYKQGEVVCELTEVRYILGEHIDNRKGKALICIGLNPSTAIPNNLDSTLKRVRSYAIANGYGAWYMLNIYPQRATNPNDIDQEINMEIHQRNIACIKELLSNVESADVWCAWGGYLPNGFNEMLFAEGGIISLFADRYKFYVSETAGDKYPRTPRHPSRLPKEFSLTEIERPTNIKIKKLLQL